MVRSSFECLASKFTPKVDNSYKKKKKKRKKRKNLLEKRKRGTIKRRYVHSCFPVALVHPKAG